jgi:hypothetical protein
LVSRRDDPSHKQKVIYSLTEASIALVPLLAHMGGWGLRHTLASKELFVRAKILKDGGRSRGPSSWRNCGTSTWRRRRPGSVVSRLQSAYEAAIAKPLVDRNDSCERPSGTALS